MSAPDAAESFPKREVLGATVFAALFLGALWWRNESFLDSDEATVGLMARSIAFHGKLPVFYWGQEYLGAVEAYLAVPLFWIFGSSVRALKLVPVAFTVATVPVGAGVAFRAGGRRLALFTALALAAPPLAFALWSIKTRGGFTEPAELGLDLVWSAIKLCEMTTERSRTKWALGTGVALGIGLWWSEFVVPFALAAIAVLLLHPRARTPKVWALGVGGAVLGALPAIWRNAFTTHWATVTHALQPDPSQAHAGQPMHAVPDVAWRNLTQIHFPAMLGFHDARIQPLSWSHDGGLAAAAIVALTIAGLVATMVLAVRAKTLVARLAALTPLIGGGSMTLLYVYSRFGFEREPRYVLALWLTVAMCQAAALALASRAHVAIGLVLWAGVAGFHLRRIYFVEDAQHVVAWNPRANVNWSFAALADALEAQGHTHVWADYWTGERLMFESHERIVSADPNGDRNEAALATVKGDPRACMLTTPGGQADQLQRRGFTRREFDPAQVPGIGDRFVLLCPP